MPHENKFNWIWLYTFILMSCGAWMIIAGDQNRPQSTALKIILEEMKAEREYRRLEDLHRQGSISATFGDCATPLGSPLASPPISPLGLPVTNHDSPTTVYEAITGAPPQNPTVARLTLCAFLRRYCGCCN